MEDQMEDNKDLMKQLIKMEILLHRYMFNCLKSRGSSCNPHNGQGRVLSILSRQPEMTQKELGNLLDIRNQSLGEILSKLVKSGYITRTPSKQDRRTTNIKLTPEGLRVAEEANKIKPQEDLFSCFNEEEQVLISSLFNRMIENLETLILDYNNETDSEEFEAHIKHMFGDCSCDKSADQ